MPPPVDKDDPDYEDPNSTHNQISRAAKTLSPLQSKIIYAFGFWTAICGTFAHCLTFQHIR